MDYKKKYKEALERAKYYYNEGKTLEYATDVVSYIFPELKESENEKIKRTLINLVKSNGTACYINKIHKDDIFAWIEKQGESKSSDKVEPKFKVGDWIVYKDGDTFSNGRKFAQITNIDEEKYWCDNWFWVKKEDIRLWTIEDAKDGDVLISSFDEPFIYNAKFDSVYVGAYCALGLNDEFIITNGQPYYFCWTAKFTVRPATEKESELLFNKMKEARYKWDADKKELIKL